MMRKAASSSRAFRSLRLVFTISMTCLRVTLPTLVLFGSFEPAAMLAAFFKSTAAGGLLVMNGNDFFDDSGLILEWTVGDFHRFTNLEADFRLHLFFPLLHLREHAVHFGLPHRDRFVLGSGKADHAGCVTNEIPGAPDQLIVFVE